MNINQNEITWEIRRIKSRIADLAVMTEHVEMEVAFAHISGSLRTLLMLQIVTIDENQALFEQATAHFTREHP